MANTTLENFSVSHAAILNGSTGAELSDIYGVRSGAVGIDQAQFENTGDDTVLSSWFWFNFATLTITSGFISWPVISLLTGDTITSSGTAPNDVNSLPLWTTSSLNQPAKPVLLRTPSRDSTGVVRISDIVLFKVQFQPITFNGPTYKAGMEVSYAGRALVSNNDEKGAVLSVPAIGRMVNHS